MSSPWHGERGWEEAQLGKAGLGRCCKGWEGKDGVQTGWFNGGAGRYS